SLDLSVRITRHTSVVCLLHHSIVHCSRLSDWCRLHWFLHSFPTRRSSDLRDRPRQGGQAARDGHHRRDHSNKRRRGPRPAATARDRKSTRLNSSHVKISYAVFCLKQKKKRAPPANSAE